MALIKCPECGKEISDQSDVCIHCGYPIKNQSGIATNLVDLVGNEVSTNANEKVEAYDVMILEYNTLKITAKNNLADICNISNGEAADILSELPCYIYDDIEQSDAEQIARRLMNCGFRVAVYDPIGRVKYFEPPHYVNRPLPILVPVPRRRRRIIPLTLHRPRVRPVVMPRKTPGIDVGLKPARFNRPSNRVEPRRNGSPSRPGANRPSGVRGMSRPSSPGPKR